MPAPWGTRTPLPLQPLPKSESKAASSRPLDKALFAAGAQCAKRLYLEYHRPKLVPAPSENQENLAEVGRELVEMACKAFPKGEAMDTADFAAATRRTKEILEQAKPVVLFHAAFGHEGVEVRADIVLGGTDKSVMLYEVKSGTKVKPRHVQDVALQIHVIEACGYKVRTASVLHLNPGFVHDGKGAPPVQQLFKSVDITERARRHLERVRDQLGNFRAVLADRGSEDLPMGTWCHMPFRCVFYAHCREQAPGHPLVEMPDLTRSQESRWHEAGIETMTRVDPQQPGLTLLQRRALKAIETGGLVVEDFVRAEMAELEHPVHLIHIGYLIDVLPRFARSRPWQAIPFQWSSHVLHADGKVEHRMYFHAEREDPRPALVRALSDHVRGAGTVVVYGGQFEDRMRELLEDVPEHKADVRLLLNAPYIDLQRLLRAGVYHPGFRGSFQLADVAAGLGAPIAPTEDIADVDAASLAYARYLNTRTRANTRERLKAGLEAFAKAQSQASLAILRALLAVPAG